MTLRLLQLRYLLLWARLRSRTGKIALFMVGYLFACLIGLMLMLGGFGAGMAAIRMGKAELVARIVLGGFFVTVTLSAVILGIGVNPTFQDAPLRRYPLSRFERLAARHFLGTLEPLWIVVLTLYVGVALGLGPAALAVPAALLLLAANYLLARVLSGLAEWAASTRTGMLTMAVALCALIMLVSTAPTVGGPALRRSPVLGAALGVTPPVAAAAVMAGGPAVGPTLLLAAWCLALTAALAGLEHLPAPGHSVSARAAWDGPCDRVAALFGETGPLLSKFLRYYARSTRGRLNYILNVPAFAFMVLTSGRQLGRLPLAIGFMAIAGFSATFNVSINVFGFDGSGFRRYFLLPVKPAAVVRAAVYAPVLLGAPLLPVCMLVCAYSLRASMDARMAVMLASNALGGLLLFPCVALWTSLLWPSRTRIDASFQNDYSLGANLVGQGAMLGTLFGTVFLGIWLKSRLVLFWWVAPLFAAAGAAFYVFTLRAAPAVFSSRREKLLSVLEPYA